ncbi:MAG TPA: DUF1801 domain-containing protein [Puia sp.]|jgi:hypothetical protein|nr:DUF1801 domain-containing protein [Puia sp.]
MLVPEFIAQQPAGRRDMLARIHAIIVEKDKTVTAVVGMMMGKEMILYNGPGMFKYGLASVKNYMSLHAMPIYGSPVLYSRYKERLPLANFQKGCINFKNEEEMPLGVVEQLISDCAGVDLLALKEKWQQQSKANKRK